MHYDSIKIAVFALAALACYGPAIAESPRLAFNPEIISTVSNWDPDSGYLILNGKRYPVSGDVEVVTRSGEPISPEAVNGGSNVGILEENGTVQKIIVFDK